MQRYSLTEIKIKLVKITSKRTGENEQRGNIYVQVLLLRKYLERIQQSQSFSFDLGVGNTHS